MASKVSHCTVQNEYPLVETGASDLIISKLEDYLVQVFGYPKAFLMVLAKASFGRQPIPIVNQESFLLKTWRLLKQIEDTLNVQNPISKEVTVCTGVSSWYQHKVTQTDDAEKDDPLIQITASASEINRRIQSFTERKRQEVDMYNKREFCVFHDDKKESTCARTEAAYVPRHGKKSLLKTYRVYNKTESSQDICPRKKMRLQRGMEYVWEPGHPSTLLEIKHISPGTYERIETLEDHLMQKRVRGGPRKTDPKQDGQNLAEGNVESQFPLLNRIKEIENRILFLEGLSPEYFGHNAKDWRYRSPHRSQFSAEDQLRYKDSSAMEKRITELRSILQTKYGGSQ